MPMRGRRFLGGSTLCREIGQNRSPADAQGAMVFLVVNPDPQGAVPECPSECLSEICIGATIAQTTSELRPGLCVNEGICC
jgi:hypothetical protein